MRQVGSRTAHRNPWFSVEHREYESASGERYPYFMVCRPDSVLVAARDDGRFVLVELPRATMGGALSLEFPQGGVSAGESPEAAARREAQEEAGLRLTGLRHVTTFAESNGFATSSCHVFLADVTGAGPTDRDPFELGLTVRRLSWAELRELAATGGVRDSATLAAMAVIGARGDVD
jgi:ADP-ribose pyrophosphatase